LLLKNLCGLFLQTSLFLVSKHYLFNVHLEIVDFGSGQGRRIFSTAGIVSLFRGLKKFENAAMGQKMLFPDGHYSA
jgi:hypothetical protein